MPVDPRVEFAIGILLQLLQVAADKSFAQDAAKYSKSAWTEALHADTVLTDPTYGLSALHADLAALRTYVDGRLDTIDVNIAGVYAATQAIIDDVAAIPAAPDYSTELQAILDAIGALPTPPTPPTPSEIMDGFLNADSLLTDLSEDTTLTWFDVLRGIFAGVEGLLGFTGHIPPSNPYVARVVSEADFAGAAIFDWEDTNAEPIPPPPDFSLLEAGDSVLSFLQRTQSNIGWTSDGPGIWTGTAQVWAPGTGTSGRVFYRALFTDLDLMQISRQLTFPPPTDPPVAPVVAPVWPGSAGVTLGTPVALADQLVVEEVMDGVIVHVTTPPGKLGSYHVGGVTLDYGAGRIAFESDGGELEPWQYLGFRYAIYTPKTMQHASKARFQVMGGALGTVTPWTRS